MREFSRRELPEFVGLSCGRMELGKVKELKDQCSWTSESGGTMV